MPNTAHDECVDFGCNEETETLCDNGKAKWCCPNNELCGEGSNQCVQSDGMCSYALIATPTTTKTYECAYKFVDTPSFGKTYECAYRFIDNPTSSKTYECSYEIVSEKNSDGVEIMGIKVVKPCANSSYYCNLQYSDETCNTSISDWITTGKTIYGSCSQPSESYSGCTLTTNSPDKIMQAVKPCPSNQYCYLKYKDDKCTTASDNISGIIYGVCLAPNSSNAICPVPQK